MKLFRNLLGIMAACALFAAPVFASSEIRAYDPSGRTLYMVVGNSLQSGAATVWTGSAFAALTTSNQTSAALSVPEASTGTGYYVASFPAGITAPGRYPVTVYEQQSSTAAPPTDVIIATGTIDWGGTAAIGTSDVNTTALSTNTRVSLALPAIAPGASGGLPTGDSAGRVVASSVSGNVGGSVASVSGNVSGSVGSVTGPVTVGTNNDKSGYNLGASQAFANSTPSTVVPTWYAAGATLAQVQALLPANFGVFSVDSTGGVKVVSLPTTAPSGYGGYAGLTDADTTAIMTKMLATNLFPGLTLGTAWGDIWATDAGPSTATAPSATQQITAYTTPAGAGQHTTVLNKNSSGQPVSRTVTHP